MKSRIFNLDWKSFDYKDTEQRKQLAGAMQVFCALPNQFVPPQFAGVQEFVKAHDELRTAKLQEFTLASNFPARAIEVFDKYHLTTDFDNGYEQIFNVGDYTGSQESGFDIVDVAAGLTFNEVKEGEKVKVYQAAGERVRCYFAYYGGALGWHRRLFEDRNYWEVEDNAIEFRNKAYSARASVFYGLLDAAADAKGCCAVLGGTTDAAAVIATLNYMAYTVFMNNVNKGYGITATTPLTLLYHPYMAGRIKQALGLQGQAYEGAPKLAAWNFQPLASGMLTDISRVFVILPKRKLKAGYRMDLTLFDDFDILSYTDTVAGWMRYGGCIADLDQIECADFEETSGSCPTSPESGHGEPLPPAEV